MGSHLTAVSAFLRLSPLHLPATHTQLRPGRGKSFSLFDTVVTPALSLLTRNLRPEGVRGAVRRLRGGQSVERELGQSRWGREETAGPRIRKLGSLAVRLFISV